MRKLVVKAILGTCVLIIILQAWPFMARVSYSGGPACCDRKQPNIILIVADDYGFHDIGYHGSEINTPNLDRLARSGVRLENYYVQPTCTPTRCQLLSGRYQIHTGLQHGIIWADQPNGLPLDSPTLADKMKEAGYSTHAVGKWHVGFYKKDYLPTSRGFDSFYGLLTGSECHYSHYRCYEKACGYDLRDNLEPVTNANGSYSTHLFVNRTIDIIDKKQPEKPLFVYLPFQAVHSPLQVPNKYIEPYKYKIKDKERRIYAGMVTCMDEAVGNITAALKRRGLWDNTVLVFTTDNGGAITEGGNNWPLRGWKGSLWEGGMHGIGFVHSKLLSDNVVGSVFRGLMHVTDWFPTLIGIAGGNLNGTKDVNGYNQWDSINTGAPSKRAEILHNIDTKFPLFGKPRYNNTFNTGIRAALRVGDLKIITGEPGNGSWVPPPYMDSTADIYKNEKNIWLFNITHDPNERLDLSADNPVTVVKMLDILTRYQKSAVPIRYPPGDKRSNPKNLGGYWGPWE